MTHQWLMLLALVPYGLAFLGSLLGFLERIEDPRAWVGTGVGCGAILHGIAIVIYLTQSANILGARPFGFFGVYVLFTALAAVMITWRYGIQELAFVFLGVPLLALLPLPFLPPDSPMTVRVPAGLLGLHLFAVVTSLSAFTIAMSAGGLLFVQDRFLKSKADSALSRRLPPLRVLDEITYRNMALGFILLTLGVALGFVAFRFRSASLSAVGFKTLLGLLAWAIYAGYLISRRRFGWRGRTEAVFAFVGFAVAATISVVASFGGMA